MNKKLLNQTSQKLLGSFHSNCWTTSSVDHRDYLPVARLNSPFLVITEEILGEAKKHVPRIQLKNDRANKFDSLTGSIGEIVFAKWMYGNIYAHYLGCNFGNGDFGSIEIKTGLIVFNSNRHLIAKANYVRKHPAEIYVQCFISSRTPQRGPLVGDTVFIAGWCYYKTLIAHGFPCNEKTRKGKDIGIKSIRLPISRLESMDRFPPANQEGGLK